MSAPTDDDRTGFDYFVSDEQLFTYAALSVERRLQWVEETRTFTWHAASPEVRESWRKLREYPQRK